MPVRIPVLLVMLAALLAAAPAAAARQWLAGDGHVHTCYSADAYCPQTDPPQDLKDFYSSMGTVGQRFDEAWAKGLHFLVISDHDDVRAWTDPAFGARGVVGVRAYEWSLDGGHAHMLGAARNYGDGAPATIAETLRADGGLFQANHPSYRAGQLVTTCEQVGAPDTPLHWKLGFSLQPDAVEVWNATSLIPPAEVFWDCWLQRGVRMPVTAGSDTHGATQPSLGLPTTWVQADDVSQAAILDGIRHGRTTLSRLPPALGGARLLIEADADRNGIYEATMGDTVPPKVPMQVRAEGLSAPALVRVRAGGRTILSDAPLLPGKAVPFEAPADARSWVRAVAYQQQWTTVVDPFCKPPPQPPPPPDPRLPSEIPHSPIDLCTSDLAITGMTSPIYVEAAPPVATPPAETPTGTGSSTPPGPSGDEPDDDPPLAPAEQSLFGAPLPAVPAQPAPASSSGEALPRLRVVVRGRRVSWTPRGLRYDVQVRRGRRWRTALRASAATSLVVGRRVRAVRVRPRAPDGGAGAWTVARRR